MLEPLFKFDAAKWAVLTDKELCKKYTEDHTDEKLIELTQSKKIFHPNWELFSKFFNFSSPDQKIVHTIKNFGSEHDILISMDGDSACSSTESLKVNLTKKEHGEWQIKIDNDLAYE